MQLAMMLIVLSPTIDREKCLSEIQQIDFPHGWVAYQSISTDISHYFTSLKTINTIGALGQVFTSLIPDLFKD